ncbi:aldo/keto reductase [uncultured Mailhella sp.]|uniref:aldo/keto reductase n=1 Tax=uncultured Mailhella sp. TaxID=1981031 RepID=UPI00262B44D6|nr:aldo/keto reductase [uncultured Mailhella sp.]
MKAFPEVKKNFGFGCMRLPLKDEAVDCAEFAQMVDIFLDYGFNYFDTAHGYMNGRSEAALRECLTSRHPRDRYVLADKLSTHHFQREEDIRPLFASQLAACGVEYFDFYLMHAQNRSSFAKYKACRAYETALELLKEGRIRHLGISFHDKAEVLEQILREYPQIEVVQIQFNYVDYEDEAVQSRKCYEVCERHGKPVIVMEPVKGGCLVNLPDAAQKILDELHGGSSASYAIRFAAGFPNVRMVLSGMGNLDMMRENAGLMRDVQPLSAAEREALQKVVAVFRSLDLIPCTSCRYCTEVCPQHIGIPDLFALLNARRMFRKGNAEYYYENVYTGAGTKAKDCLKCGSCEKLCPQHLPVRELLARVSAEFDT